MRLIVIDDDPLIVIALTTILSQEADIDVVATGHSYEEALQLFKTHRPDLCLLDIQLGEKSGIDAAKALKDQFAFSEIVFLTTFLDDTYIKEALALGVRGYILKQDVDRILPAVRAAYAGHSVFGSEVMQKIPDLENALQDWRHHGLTDKELDIFSLVAEGYSNREIAKTLYLSEGAVRNYISKLLEKVEVRDRTQLAIAYLTKTTDRRDV